jgi:hypothetical protein
MRIVRINTTAYEEEDFFLMTDLTDIQIEEVLTPIVELERNDEVYYTNDELTDALIDKYSNNVIVKYTDFETITI